MTKDRVDFYLKLFVENGAVELAKIEQYKSNKNHPGSDPFDADPDSQEQSLIRLNLKRLSRVRNYLCHVNEEGEIEGGPSDRCRKS